MAFPQNFKKRMVEADNKKKGVPPQFTKKKMGAKGIGPSKIPPGLLALGKQGM
jgi:hypothetical protein